MRGGIYIEGYADDFCLLSVGKFPKTVSGFMRWAFHTVATWRNEVGLSVNPDKTGLIVFTKRKNFLVSLNHILRSMWVKYLGIVLDCR